MTIGGGGGVTASLINRGEKGLKFGKKLKEAIEERNVDVRILINNKAEILLGEKTSGEFSKLKNEEIDKVKATLVFSKLKDVLKNYQNRVKTDMKGNIQWFPHGDIRIFMSDAPKDGVNGQSRDELMIVTSGPTLGGEGEPKKYTALITQNDLLTREHLKRFKVNWEHAAIPDYWEKVERESKKSEEKSSGA